MKIYDTPGFPNPARIRIVLAEKGLDAQVQFVKVDLVGAEHKQAAFLAKNPTGVVPVLELDDGTLITESVAISAYLDNLDGQPTLTGTTPREKALIAMMQKRADDQLIDAIGSYFHFGTVGLGDQLQAHKSPEWAGRTEWAGRERDKYVQGLKDFNEVLKTRPYLAGEQFSVADITAFAAMLHAVYAGVAIPVDCEALLAWQARVAARPSVQNRSGQAIDAEDLRRLGL
ncbi:glutathione S-transferase family protein [Rugamonas sp.]|uniref:glutathione S-transferase family protein n=1 Tax=Rugamonas sp. TaxID=1926287 RepID=UPI0025E4F05F|nr:glutathione S-transferase family protein [Rugamonas sp.]